MVKSYLRFEQGAVLGLVAHSSACQSIAYANKGKTAIAAALEEVRLWDLRRGELVRHTHFPPGSSWSR